MSFLSCPPRSKFSQLVVSPLQAKSRRNSAPSKCRNVARGDSQSLKDSTQSEKFKWCVLSK
ncbi:hypothetical protein TYRP_020166 [Tyrophagus putrescentiae]|nr:hypothetical protein TYRP_020166 [Tyrophagus putrescentiae]